jgi:transcriptional regulator with XRE-family HTH domain
MRARTASLGVMPRIDANLHGCVNAFLHSPDERSPATIRGMALLDKNLRYLLRQQPISQESLGKLVGMSQPNLGRIIRGVTPNPGYLTVQALAQHFNVSLNDLVFRDLEHEGVGTPSQSVALDAEIMASALVTVDKALKHYRVDFARLYEHSELLMLAYMLRLQHPRTMTKAQYAIFDQAVISMFSGVENGARDREAAPDRSGEAGTGTATRPTSRRRAAGRAN